MRRPWLRPTVAVATVSALVAGCSAKVGSSVSPCFRILPEAHAAVAGQGTFVDVVRIRGRRIDAFADPNRPPPQTTSPTSGTSGTSGTSTTSTTQGPAVGDSRRDVCVVAYRGAFDPTSINNLEGAQRQGAYAVVMVGVRSQRVRHVFLTDRLPPPLRRR